MNQTEKTVVLISIVILVFLVLALGFVISNDSTFRQRFNIDKPNIFQEMYNS